jgi:hypothetical protein
MRVFKAQAIEALNNESARLRELAASCEQQARTLEAVSFQGIGLRGEAYGALEARVRARAVVLRAHRAAFEAVMEANDEHVRLLEALPEAGQPGVLDVDECLAEAVRARQEAARLRASRGSVVRAIQNGGLEDIVVPAYVFHNYDEQIALYEEAARTCEGKAAAAQDYAVCSAGLYGEAAACVGGLLAASTRAVASCLGAGGWDRGAFEALEGLCAAHWKAKEAKAYLTPEQWEAYRAALAGGGVPGLVEEGELYSGGRLNEDLYAALARLPDRLVDGREAEACARAYAAMWAGPAPDIASIERFFCLSYVPAEDDSLPVWGAGAQGFGGYSPDYLVREFGCSYLQESPLLARIARASAAQLGALAPGDAGYDRALAATGLLASSLSGCRIAANGPMVARLAVMEEGSRGGAGAGATLCRLELDCMSGTAMRELASGNGVYAVALPDCAYTVYSATGPLAGTAGLLDRLKRGALTRDEVDVFGIDFLAEESLSQAIGFIPGIGAPLSAFCDYAFDIASQAEDVRRGAAIRDGSYTDMLRAPYGLLGECGFGLGVRIPQSGVDPADYNAFHATAYVPDAARPLIDAMAEAYSESLGAGPSLGEGQPLYGGSQPAPPVPYTADDFLRDIQEDTLGSLVAGEGANATWGFLAWGGPAPSTDLVYRSSGEPVRVISNYHYLKWPDDEACQDMRFKWETEGS